MYKTQHKYLGKANYINTAADMGEEYYSLAQSDEEAARVLKQNKLYNQACYYYIQAMEKYIKAAICKKVDITKPYFANKIRELGHSLDKAVDFFLEIIVEGKDDILAEMLKNQLKNSVLQNIRFGGVHNAVRYPTYNEKHKNYIVTKMSKADTVMLENMVTVLKKYIEDTDII